MSTQTESDHFSELFETITGTTVVTEGQERGPNHDPVSERDEIIIDLEDGLRDAVGTPEDNS